MYDFDICSIILNGDVSSDSTIIDMIREHAIRQLTSRNLFAKQLSPRIIDMANI